MTDYKYQMIVTWSDEDNAYIVSVPDLPGCITEGHSLSEAIEMGIDAASGWILDEIEDGNPYPAASRLQDVTVPAGSFVNFLLLDMDNYAEHYGDKAVRKAVTLPMPNSAR